MHAVELEVEQLAYAQPTCPSQEQCIGSESELGSSEGLAETPVGVDGQIARKGARQAWGVGTEDEPSFGYICPSPLGDVIEEAGNGMHPSCLIGGRDRLAVLGVDRIRHRVQVGLYVPLSIKLSQRLEFGVDVSEEAAEVDKTSRHTGHRVGPAGS